MKKLNLLIISACVLAIGASKSFAQTSKPIASCKQATFAAYHPLPKLEYDCPEAGIDADLKLPARIAAINDVVTELESLTDAAWWQANVDDLNACELHGSAGALNDEEKGKWGSGEYGFSLFGNHQMRLVLLSDPCYQTGYNGSNVFLLYRRGAKVFVTELLDGYYSRVDNSVGIAFAQLNGRQVIEISTANNMPPSLHYYYFAIDSKTNRAVPINLFRDGQKRTNEIWSAMLLSGPADLGLPKSAAELKVIQRHRLAPSFSAYEENDRGRIEDNGRRLRRIVYRWNGRFYSRARN